MTGIMFANETVIVLSFNGRTLSVPTSAFRDTTLLRMASELLAEAARRSDVWEPGDGISDRGVPDSR